MDEEDIKLTEYHDCEGRRHLRLEAAIPVLPYMRMTRNTRFADTSRGRRAANYVAWVAGVKTLIANAMRLRGIEPFGNAPLVAHFTINISDQRRLYRADVTNYAKAIEDAANSALWADDRWIVLAHCFKHQVPSDGFTVEAWEVTGG